jgi:ApbE superfamily uncharacterized protein (UPF0280 family)
MIPPTTRRMPDGVRLHMQHGPMDLIVRAEGPRDAVRRAETAAISRFETILAELVPQLPVLRSGMRAGQAPDVQGSVAARMVRAAGAFTDVWVTPMIAVAGSVAEEVCSMLAGVAGVTSAYVNNGGDVAVHLEAGAELRVGLVADVETGTVDAVLDVHGDDGIGGMATSGWSGRSHSLGIADAVTVVGSHTSFCDAAATLIANTVDLPGHPAIERVRASALDPDSDLGDQLVTVSVPRLGDDQIDRALAVGVAEARRRLEQVPQLHGVVLHLQGRRRVVGDQLAARLTPPREVAHAG